MISFDSSPDQGLGRPSGTADHRLRLVLVLPAIGKLPGQPYIRAWQMEPLAMAKLAALTPDWVDIRFMDDRMEDLDFEVEADLVGISVETYTAFRAYQIAMAFRRRGRAIVMGGFHASLCPEEVSDYADAVVVGQAEGCWNQLLEDFRAGRMQKIYKAASIPPAELDRVPDRRIYGNRPYVNVRLLEAGRGCKFRCEFCSIQQFFEGHHLKRRVEVIVEEIRQIHAPGRLLFFVDDNITSDVPFARALFEAMIPLGVHWVGQADITIARDSALLDLMVRSGCQGVLIGFESLRPESLRLMNKAFNAAGGGPEQAVRQIHRKGLRLYATFLYGYGDEGPEDLDAIIRFCIRQKIFMVGFNHLTPFPGTPLYRRLGEQGLLLFRTWWLDPHYRYGMIPFKTTTDHRLIESKARKARKRFYGLWSILVRMTNLTNINRPSMLLYYFGINWMLRKDAGLRMQFPLGDRRPGVEGASSLESEE